MRCHKVSKGKRRKLPMGYAPSGLALTTRRKLALCSTRSCNGPLPCETKAHVESALTYPNQPAAPPSHATSHVNPLAPLVASRVAPLTTPPAALLASGSLASDSSASIFAATSTIPVASAPFDASSPFASVSFDSLAFFAAASPSPSESAHPATSHVTHIAPLVASLAAPLTDPPAASGSFASAFSIASTSPVASTPFETTPPFASGSFASAFSIASTFPVAPAPFETTPPFATVSFDSPALFAAAAAASTSPSANAPPATSASPAALGPSATCAPSTLVMFAIPTIAQPYESRSDAPIATCSPGPINCQLCRLCLKRIKDIKRHLIDFHKVDLKQINDPLLVSVLKSCASTPFNNANDNSLKEYLGDVPSIVMNCDFSFLYPEHSQTTTGRCPQYAGIESDKFAQMLPDLIRISKDLGERALDREQSDYQQLVGVK